MENLINELMGEYVAKNYELFFHKFNIYLENGYAVDLKLICCYIRSLIGIRKYDTAYKLCKWLENVTNYPEINSRLFNYYVFMMKSKDAERIYNRGNIDIENKAYIIKMYMYRGNYEKAKEIAEKCLQDEKDKQILDLKLQIFNHEKLNAFIEIDYESFIEQGNELQPGHIIYLKNKPASNNTIINDEKCSERPYLVWKFDKNKIYLFPVSAAKPNNHGFKLYQQKYPNSKFDRVIKNNLCWTTFDNILSVKDKVLDEDMNAVFTNIFYSIYFSGDLRSRIDNGDFVHNFTNKVVPNSVITIAGKNENDKRKYYFVISVSNNYYRVIELGYPFKVIGEKAQLISRNILLYNVAILEEPIIEELKKQIPYGILNNSFVGARVSIIEDNYIVLEEQEDFCICVNANYPETELKVVNIKKEDINNVISYVNNETINSIKEYLSNNSKHTFTKIKKEA